MVRWPNPKNLRLPRKKAARLAAAKARHITKPADKKRTAWEFGALVWNAHVAFWRDLTAIALGIVGFFGVIAAAVLLYKAVYDPGIAIAPISVPKELADEGYTPDVAAVRLRTALNDVYIRAFSLRRRISPQPTLKNINVIGTAPNIIVPGTAFSIEALSAKIHSFYHPAGRSDVSGEITIVDSKLWLRLRLNGDDIYASAGGGDPKRPDDLYTEAAQEIFDETDPYLLAVSLSESDPDRTLEIAKRIIASRPESDPTVPWTHILIGNMLRFKGDIGVAIAEYHKAIVLDPRSAIARYNLGVALKFMGKYQEALAEYRMAIELDPRNALVHSYLGSALYEQGKIDEAIAEYKKAIDLDPRFASPHISLGNALRGQGRTDEAITEYEKAIDLDPRFAIAHNNLGGALRDQGKTDEAITEYKKAIELDPRDTSSHNNLGVALRDQGKTDEAIAEYKKAIDLDPRYAKAHRNLSIALRKQGKNDAADAEEKKALDLEQKP